MHAFYYTSGDVTKFPPYNSLEYAHMWRCRIYKKEKIQDFHTSEANPFITQYKDKIKSVFIINYMNFFKLNSRNYKFINICIYFVGSR